MNEVKYIIRGLNADGSVARFYSGRAGQLWLTAEREEAFRYADKFAAQQKAKLFNTREPLHGFYFVATVE